jgi:hypothetical protein
VVLECDGAGKCWCPEELPDGQRQPLDEEQCRKADEQYPQLPAEMAAGVRGERRQAAKPSGTNNEFKKMKPHPTKTDKVLYRDPHTGKEVEKPKPPGFDDWWKTR